VERIKQALERAQAERKIGLGAGSPPISTIPDPAHSRLAPSPAQPPATRKNIAYTRTLPVPVDPACLRESRIICTEEKDSVADAYKVLRTHVVQRMRANGWKTMGVTSPTEGSGKSLTAINLAISLAGEVNQTVLLVDLDLRRPSLRQYFVNEPVKGLSDYLTDGAAVADLLIHPGIERLVILPGNHSFTQSSEMLSSPKMVQLVEELKTRYADRLTIFDLPPVLAGDDVIAFLPYLDSVMLVVEEARTTKDELARAFQLLGENKVLGTVLNKSADTTSMAGYY